jgi:uncharacterized protein with GYD domain
MPRYISLLKFTDKGAATVAKTITRAHAFDKSAAKLGITVVGQYWTLGGYDGVLITSGDDKNALLRLLDRLLAQGNVRCETMEAFTDVEIKEILG